MKLTGIRLRKAPRVPRLLRHHAAIATTIATTTTV
jgi:hypothetical protein